MIDVYILLYPIEQFQWEVTDVALVDISYCCVDLLAIHSYRVVGDVVDRVDVNVVVL